MADIVAEHGAGGPEPKTTEPMEDIGKVVHELLKRSKRASADVRKKIPENYNFFVGGKQWSIDRPSWRFSEVVNTSLGIMLQEVGIQTDGRPKTDFEPQEPMDVDFIETLKELNDRNWSKGLNEGFGWPNRLEEHIFEVKYSDWSWAEIAWDPTLSGGIGDIGWKKLDPVYCYWDPTATTVHDLRWFIYIEPVPTKVLQAEYPDKKDMIKPDIRGFDASGNSMNRDYNIDRQWLASLLETGDMAGPYEHEDRFGGEEMTLKIRCWVKDGAVEEVQESKDLEQTVTKLKYPKGRYIEMAGQTVLCDHANGVKIKGEVHAYEDGLFPIALLRNYSLPGKLIGLSEAPFLKGPQRIINYVWSFILDSMKMAGNPKVTVKGAAQELMDQITNEPGSIYPVTNQDDVMFHEGKGVAPGVQQILDTAMGLQDKVQGQQDVSRGASQPGVTSGLMMEGFVEASQTRPRLKNRNVDQFLTQIGTLMLSRIFQFYTAPRVFRITNKKENWPEHLEFWMEPGEEPQQYVANVTAIGPNGQRGDTQKMMIGGKPDVIVKSGSALPYGRAQKQAVAGEQFRMGAIDLQTYLEDVGRTDAPTIIERVKQQQAEQAQAAPPQGG